MSINRLDHNVYKGEVRELKGFLLWRVGISDLRGFAATKT